MSRYLTDDDEPGPFSDVVASFIFLVAFFHRVAPGVMAKDLMESFRARGTFLGLLSSVYFYGLFFVMGAAGSAFVLTWPIGREVNPPQLAGVSVAVVNLGGLLGAALSQGPSSCPLRRQSVFACLNLRQIHGSPLPAASITT